MEKTTCLENDVRDTMPSGELVVSGCVEHAPQLNWQKSTTVAVPITWSHKPKLAICEHDVELPKTRCKAPSSSTHPQAFELKKIIILPPKL